MHMVWHMVIEPKLLATLSRMSSASTEKAEKDLLRLTETLNEMQLELGKVSAREKVVSDNMDVLTLENVTLSSAKTVLESQVAAHTAQLNAVTTRVELQQAEHIEIVHKKQTEVNDLYDKCANMEDTAKRMIALQAEMQVSKEMSDKMNTTLNRSELKIGILTEENESLRKANHCSCIIS